jgi:hypothetical protein
MPSENARRGPAGSAASSKKREAQPLDIGPAIFTMIGLLLALSATLGGPGSLEGELAARLAIRLPDWVVVVAVGALFASALLILGFLRPQLRRRKRKDEPEFVPYYEPPKLTLSTLAGLVALLLVPLGILVYLLWAQHGSLPPEAGHLARQPGGPMAPPSVSALPSPPTATAPLFNRFYIGLVLLLTLGVLGFILWLHAGGLPWRRGRLEAPEPIEARLAEAVDDSLDDLRTLADARAAIIKCYLRFEEVAARAALPRHPWETPTEYMGRALASMTLPADAVARLTHLFELSRFSDHPLGAADRDAAWHALANIRRSLKGADRDAGT